MKLRTVFSTILLSLAISAANAQTTEPDKAAPPADQATPATPATAAQTTGRETAPDAKALQDASRINDPVKKIEALNKFKKDFPTSASLTTADMDILSTVASRMPDQKARVRTLAKSIYSGAKDKQEKGSLAGRIAETLLTNNLLLKDAEKYAQTSLAAMDQTEYLADQKAQFAKRAAGAAGRGGRGGRGGQPLSDEELIKRFKQNRATRVGTLGRIEFKRGKTSVAQKLLDESYGVNPDQPAVVGTLGELAAKQGNNTKAIDYLVTARLSGKAPASANLALAAVYSKMHNGSAAGLDALLDAEYNKRFPNPVHVEAYKATEKRSDRLVLAEVFTGSGCPPCVGADLAFEAAMERYSRKDLAVVMYHQHVPQPDPMTNPDTQARSKYYNVTGVPTYTVDGETVRSSGAGRDGAKGIFDRIQTPIEKGLELAAEARLTVNASASGNSVNVTAAVDGVKSDSKDLKVHILVLEKELKYSGENGIRFHPMVVRAMGGKDDDGFALAPGAPVSFEQAWDLDKVSAGLKAHLDDYEAKGHRGNSFKFSEKKYQIDRGHLAIVVFVQDAKTKHILQSAFVDLNPSAPYVSTDANESK
jgi:thiol-disulfide isomerase/thioredoxin